MCGSTERRGENSSYELRRNFKEHRNEEIYMNSEPERGFIILGQIIYQQAVVISHSQHRMKVRGRDESSK